MDLYDHIHTVTKIALVSYYYDEHVRKSHNHYIQVKHSVSLPLFLFPPEQYERGAGVNLFMIL